MELVPHVRHRGFLIPSNMVCRLLIVLSENSELSFPIYHHEELVDYGNFLISEKFVMGALKYASESSRSMQVTLGCM